MAMARSAATDETIRMLQDAQLIRFHGVGALAYLFWDIILTCGDEMAYIWPQSSRSPTKWVFLFTRYFGLLAQARLVTINQQLNHSEFSLEVCKMLYISQVMFSGILMACMQCLLMVRVYALFSQDRRVALAMISLLIAEVGSMPGIIHMTIPTAAGNMCMKPITIKDIALFGVSALLPQIIVLGLTIAKFFSGLRAGWARTPVVSLLVRDDLIMVSVIAVWVCVCAGLTSVRTVYGYIGFYWLLSIIPTVGCRVVLNMQKLAYKSTRHERRRRQWHTRGADSEDFSNSSEMSQSAAQLTNIFFDALSLPSPIAAESLYPQDSDDRLPRILKAVARVLPSGGTSPESPQSASWISSDGSSVENGSEESSSGDDNKT